MSSASDRRKSSGGGDDGSGANWMDTYGDLVTLLLTFFVLLFSMSNVDAAKWKALVGSFTGMSVVGIDPLTPEIVAADPIPRWGMTTADEYDSADSLDMQDLRAIYEILSDFVEKEGINASLMLEEDEYRVRLVFNDMVFFNTADATVLPEAYTVLDSVIEMFMEVDHLYAMLSVEGHTDSRPIHSDRYPSNWDVSVHRATNVVSYFRADGRLDKSRLVAVGYGEEHPIVPNDTPENMRLNRRVEFVVDTRSRFIGSR